LGVCLSQITRLGEGRRVLCAGLANSLCMRKTRRDKKRSSKRKVKEHFLTCNHNNINGTNCLCVVRKEHLKVMQGQNIKKAPGWQRVLVPEDPHTHFPGFIHVRCKICSKI